MRVVLLIRHGENDVMKRRLAGRLPGVHLNEKGRQQASVLAEHLKDLPLRAVYSSPLERAVETAEPLAARRGLPVEVVPGLVEVDYGRWQGRTFKQLGRSKLWKTVQSTPSAVRFPGGETLAEVQCRVLAEIERLTTEEGVIACFAHGDIVRLALVHYLTMPVDSFQRLAISPASISAVLLTKDAPLVLCVNQQAAFTLPPEKPKDEPKKSNDG